MWIDRDPFTHFGSLIIGVDERFYIKWNLFALQWLKGFGVNYGCPIKSELDSFLVRDMMKELGRFEMTWIGIENTRHILPNGNRISIETIRKNRCCIIRPFTAKRSRKIVIIASNKPLRDIQSVWADLLIDSDLCPRPVHVRISIACIGLDAFSRIKPISRNAF